MLLRVFIALLVVGYIGINFLTKLPAFLMAQNITYAVLYALGLLLLKKRWGPLYLTVLAGFNAGRVSRSLISPRGEIGYLALEHIPLFTAIIIVLLLALMEAKKRYF